MSFGVTKEKMEDNHHQCLANISKDEGKEIKRCEDCPLYDGCRSYAEEQWDEAVEKARLPNGRFGKLYLEKEAST